MKALKGGYRDIARVLLDLNININLSNIHGDTALHWAVIPLLHHPYFLLYQHRNHRIIALQPVHHNILLKYLDTNNIQFMCLFVVLNNFY